MTRDLQPYRGRSRLADYGGPRCEPVFVQDFIIVERPCHELVARAGGRDGRRVLGQPGGAAGGPGYAGELGEAQFQNSSAVYVSDERSQNSVAFPFFRCHTWQAGASNDLPAR